MVWIPEVISSLFESKKEEEKDEDFVTKTSNFVDNHLGAFRAGTLLLAGTGILIIVKRTYLFSWFRSANDIPKEFITKGISLRGQVKGISNHNTLEVLHIPLFTTSTFRNYKESNELSSNHLSLALAGVEFRDGSNKWLTDNLVNSHIKFLPLGINQESQCISSIVHKKRGYFRRNICVNEELVRQGLAVTGNRDKSLKESEKFNDLYSRLFKAEAYALRKHKGVWHQATILERIKRMKLPVLPNFIIWRKKPSNGSTMHKNGEEK